MENIFSKYAFIGDYRIEITILNKKGKYTHYIVHLDNIHEIINIGSKLEEDLKRKKKKKIQVKIFQTKPYLFLVSTQIETGSLKILSNEINKHMSEIIIRKLVKEI